MPVEIGLVSCGSAGAWSVDVDEALSGPSRWFTQIEGPSVYLYSEIASPATIGELAELLTAKQSPLAQNCQGCDVESLNATVTLLRDDEYSDRCFFLICAGTTTVRIAVAGDEFADLAAALRDVRDDLATNE